MSKLLLIVLLALGCFLIFSIVAHCKFYSKHHLHKSFMFVQLMSRITALLGTVSLALYIMLSNSKLLWLGLGLYVAGVIFAVITHWLPIVAIKVITRRLKHYNKSLPKDLQFHDISKLGHLASTGNLGKLLQFQAKKTMKSSVLVNDYLRVANLADIQKSDAKQALIDATHGNIKQYHQIEQRIEPLKHDTNECVHLVNKHHNSLKSQAKDEAKLAKNPVYIKAVKMMCKENDLDFNQVKHAMNDALHGHPDALTKIDKKLNQDKDVTNTLQHQTGNNYDNKQK